jgi:hypothetical protein
MIKPLQWMPTTDVKTIFLPAGIRAMACNTYAILPGLCEYQGKKCPVAIQARIWYPKMFKGWLLTRHFIQSIVTEIYGAVVIEPNPAGDGVMVFANSINDNSDDVIDNIQGIGPAGEAKLAAAGIHSLDDLRKSQLVEAGNLSGIPVATLRSWQQMALLQRIFWMVFKSPPESRALI